MLTQGMDAAVECNMGAGDMISIASGHVVLPSLEILPRLRARDQGPSSNGVFTIYAS